WEGHEAAREQRGLVIDALRDTRPPTQGEELSLLLAGRWPVPSRGRSSELARLAAGRESEPGCPVVMVGGPAGVGKSRLALEFASPLPGGGGAGGRHARGGGGGGE